MNIASATRAVIFDMDGVLTDSEPLINAAAVAMFRELGLVVKPEDFLPFVGAGEDRYIGGVAELYQFPIDLAHAKHRTYELYLQLVPSRLQAFDGAVELVRQCIGAGLKVAVASSADRIKVEANLNQIGLPPWLWQAVITGEDAARKKPAPDLFLAAAAKLQVAPSECVVVEDAVNGIQAAKAAGMRCVAVAQTFPADTLRAADVVLSGIKALPLSWLAQHAVPPLFAHGGIDSAPPIISPLPAAVQEPQVRPWGFWASAGFGLLTAIAWVTSQSIIAILWVMLQGALGHDIPHENLELNGGVIATSTLGGLPVVIGFCWLFARLRQGMPAREYHGLKWPSGRAMLGSFGALIVVMVLSDVLTLAMDRSLVPEVMVDAYKSAGLLTPLFWIAIVVGAPLGEELLFRGFVFEGMSRSRLGGWGTIILTSTVWAGIHLQYDWYGIVTILMTGLLLGYVRLKTGSIYLTMLLHGFMNLVASCQVVWMLYFRG